MKQALFRKSIIYIYEISFSRKTARSKRGKHSEHLRVCSAARAKVNALHLHISTTKHVRLIVFITPIYVPFMTKYTLKIHFSFNFSAENGFIVLSDRTKMVSVVHEGY